LTRRSALTHSDKRYRPSLASDLMEPVRPVADRIAFELLRDREFSRGQVVEIRQGVGRLGTDSLASMEAMRDALREAVGQHAERLARELLAGADHPMPLTRKRQRPETGDAAEAAAK
jgi:CRISPR/Cas system-associated endonuclease Cas1